MTWVRFVAKTEILLFANVFIPALGPIHLPAQGIAGILSSEVKWT